MAKKGKKAKKSKDKKAKKKNKKVKRVKKSDYMVEPSGTETSVTYTDTGRKDRWNEGAYEAGMGYA